MEEITDRAGKLAAQLRSQGPAGVFIENVGEFATFTIDPAIADTVTELVRACLDEDGFVAGEGETSTLGSRSGPLELLKRSRYGLALTPDQGDGDRVITTEFPLKLSRADFPPGRALFVHSRQTPVVGIGWAGEGMPS